MAKKTRTEKLPALGDDNRYLQARAELSEAAKKLRESREEFAAATAARKETNELLEEGAGSIARADAAEQRTEAARESYRGAYRHHEQARAALEAVKAEILPGVERAYRDAHEELLVEAVGLMDRLWELKARSEELRQDYRRAIAHTRAESDSRGTLRGEVAPFALPDMKNYRRRLADYGYESFDTEEFEQTRKAERAERNPRISRSEKIERVNREGRRTEVPTPPLSATRER